MARTCLDWTVRDLAREAKLAAATVNRFEVGRVTPNPATLTVIRQAFEREGVRFTEKGCVCPPEVNRE